MNTCQEIANEILTKSNLDHLEMTPAATRTVLVMFILRRDLHIAVLVKNVIERKFFLWHNSPISASHSKLIKIQAE